MTTVILRAKLKINERGLVKALGQDPKTGAAIQNAVHDIIGEAHNVLFQADDPEAREVAGRVGANGDAGEIALFTARIVPGEIPVGLVTSDHPASKRWEYGYDGSHSAIFRGRRGRRGRGSKKNWRAKTRVPTPKLGYMRTALLRAATKPGRKRVFSGEHGGTGFS